MTLHDFRLAAEGHTEAWQRRDGWLAWHIAALGRAKRMPKLERMMPVQRRPTTNLSSKIKSALLAHNMTVH